MTLSNFDWTDKTSVKWFILLPTGHEGPYSLEVLIGKKTSQEIKIWAEGLSSPVILKIAIQNSQTDKANNDLLPDLPLLPTEQDIHEDSVPPLPFEAYESSQREDNRFKKLAGMAFGLMVILFLGLREWTRSQEEFKIVRMTKMSPDLYKKINDDFKFENWNKKIFFKEYVPMDMSHIWLVTSSYHTCEVEAQFSSVEGRLLSKNSNRVSFKSIGKLKDHIAEFSHFDFLTGNKIIPGLYEMDLKATDCKWDGLAAKIGNSFMAPEESYITRMKVVLYNRGSAEFNSLLDQLIRKKIDQELKNKNQEELFWQDLQQKLQTLLAVSLQIEQLLIDFLDEQPANYKKKLKPTVDKYTSNFGHFLTQFVVSNEEYFKVLSKSDLSDLSKKRSYETMVKLTTKKIGFESMRIIEELQTLKKPTPQSLDQMDIKVKKRFQEIKELINNKIIQVTEDRTK